MNLPAINQRVKDIVHLYANGSDKKFSELLELSNSQKFNRIFNVDSRNNKIPLPTSETLIAIANKFSDIDLEWLLTGKGEMIKKEEIEFSSGTIEIIKQQLQTINSQQRTIEELIKKIPVSIAGIA